MLNEQIIHEQFLLFYYYAAARCVYIYNSISRYISFSDQLFFLLALVLVYFFGYAGMLLVSKSLLVFCPI